jgi:hypothetical protein
MSQNSLRLRQMMIVQYVQLKKNTTVTSARAKAEGRLHVSPLSCQSIVHRPLASFPPPLPPPPPPLLLPSPTNEPMVPDVNMCRSNLKRNKSKTLRDFGRAYLKFALRRKVPSARSRAWPCTACCARYIKHLHYARSVERRSLFFQSRRSDPVVGA